MVDLYQARLGGGLNQYQGHGADALRSSAAQGSLAAQTTRGSARLIVKRYADAQGSKRSM